MAETMKLLADNYIVGIVVACIIVIALYVLISVKILLYARKQNIDVCVSALIPLYHIVILIRAIIKKKKDNNILTEDEEISF